MDEKIRRFLDWEVYYQDEAVERMPWYTEGLDQDVLHAIKEFKIKTSSSLIDIGTGPGTQAIELAGLGFTVTATDISSTAIEGARKLSKEAGLTVDFIVDDIRDNRAKGKFDVVLDRGCFHALQPEERSPYVDTIAGLLKSGGYLILKTFSAKEPMIVGPYRFSCEDIKEIFSSSFEVLSVKESLYYGMMKPLPFALFSILKKKPPLSAAP